MKIHLSKIHLSILIFFITTIVRGQDTLTLLQYNLLNYGNYTSYCTPGNNSHEQKDVYLRAIINYTRPDIFTVNELSEYEYYHDRLLTEVLNSSGRTYYKRADWTNVANSYIVNQLYYDSRKLELHSQKVIQYYIRDINLYTLYAKNADLARGDTTFIHCIVAHLKAGSGGSNAAGRTTMTRNVMDWLRNNAQPGNFLIMGDFNVYTSTETAYQNLINPLPANAPFRFIDPVNKPGDWNNNYDFRYWHTQSVSERGNGCQSGGGMDDRFDFILASSSIIDGSQKVKYIQDSYKAVGQDGRHYNISITDPPTNTSVPANVLNALGNNSDHLPVMMKLKVGSASTNALTDATWQGSVSLIYIPDSYPVLRVSVKHAQQYRLRLYGITGIVLYEESVALSPGENELNLPMLNFSPGFYLVRLENNDGQGATVKLVW